MGMSVRPKIFCRPGFELRSPDPYKTLYKYLRYIDFETTVIKLAHQQHIFPGLFFTAPKTTKGIQINQSHFFTKKANRLQLCAVFVF